MGLWFGWLAVCLVVCVPCSGLYVVCLFGWLVGCLVAGAHLDLKFEDKQANKPRPAEQTPVMCEEPVEGDLGFVWKACLGSLLCLFGKFVCLFGNIINVFVWEACLFWKLVCLFLTVFGFVCVLRNLWRNLWISKQTSTNKQTNKQLVSVVFI